MNIIILSLILAQNPPEGLVHTVIAANVVAHFADISTTQYALGTGRYHEANPFLRNVQSPVKMAIVKGSIATGTSYLLLKLHKSKPKTAFVIASCLTVFTTTVAYKNSRLLTK